MFRLLSRYNKALESNPILVTSLTTGFCYGAGDVVAQSLEMKTNGKTEIDKKRLIVFTLFGTCLGGPIYYFWFAKVDTMPRILGTIARWNERRNLVFHFSRELEHHTAKNTIGSMSMKQFRMSYKENFDSIQKPLIRSKTILVAKIYADQFIFSPFYIVFFMMTTGTALEYKNNEDQTVGANVSNAISKAWVGVKKKFIDIYITDCALWPLAQMANFAFVPTQYQAIFVNIINIGWNAFLSYASRNH